MPKKTAIAAAVAGAFAASAAAQAAVIHEQGEAESSLELYGFVNAQVETASVDAGGAANAAGTEGFVIFNTAGDDSGAVLSDQAESRIGLRGTQDLGNGLSSFYRIEYGMGTSAFDEPGGSVEEDGDLEQRLANAGLSGSFGTIKVGQQWGVLYEYSGWNIFRGHAFGGSPWYWATSLLNDDWFGLRNGSVSYTYGGGGYGSDPFTFTAQAIMDQSESADDPARPDEANPDEETLDAINFGAQATFGSVTVNGVYYQENNTGPLPEPSLLSLGGRWSSGPFYLGASWLRVDRDNAGGNEPTVLIGLAGYDFGDGLNLQVGAGSGDADTAGGVGDLTSYFAEVSKSIGSTALYAELEHAATDNTAPGGGDSETTVFTVGIKRRF